MTGAIEASVITERHNDDPNYKPLMGTDVAAIKVRGRTEGSTILLEGKADPIPDSEFWACATRSAKGQNRTSKVMPSTQNQVA